MPSQNENSIEMSDTKSAKGKCLKSLQLDTQKSVSRITEA